MPAKSAKSAKPSKRSRSAQAPKVTKPDRYRRVYAAVSRVPKGRVATYGQIATVAGLPRQARFVGYALHALAADSDVPWHRIVNAAGEISLRADALGHDELQAELLRREGVRFVGGAIPLAYFFFGNPKRVPEPSRDGGRRAKLAGSPRDRWQPRR